MTPGPAGAVVQAPVLRVDARLSLNDKPGGAGAEKVAAAGPSAQWELTTEDRTLKNALSRWCRQAGWQLLWDLRVDYALSSRATLHGNFEEAVSRVMRDMSEAETPLHAVLYRGNKVLRIVARGSD
jgi:hypothetical protein